MIDIGPDQVESFKLLTTALTKIHWNKNESYYDMLTLTTIILFKRILF